MGRARAAPAFALTLLAGCSNTDIQRVEGRLVLDPAQANFGRVPTALRVAMPIELSNRGAGRLTWTAHLDEAPAGLTLSSREGALESGARAQLEVSLIADTPGDFATRVRFETNSREAPEVIMPVIADLTEDVLVATPARVDFGPVRTDRRVTRQVEVANLAPTPVRLTLDLEAGADGLEVLTASPLVIEARQTAIVELAVLGQRDGSLEDALVMVGDCDPVCALRVPVSGALVDASVACAPTALDFGATNLFTCGLLPLRCTNHAPEAVLVEAAVLDPQTSPFSADPPPLPQSVAAGEVLELEVAYCPRAARSDEALLTLDVLEADVGPRRTTVPVRGRGGGPNITVSANLIDFGGATLGGTRTRTLEVTNVGDRPLHLAGFTVEPPDVGFTPPLDAPRELAPGASSTLELGYEASFVGLARAELVIVSNDPDEPQRRVTLEAEGFAPGACTARLSPEAVSFGLVDVGATSEVDVELSAGPDAPCTWLAPRVEGDPAFGLRGVPSRRGDLPPGGRVRFTVVYDASEPSEASGDIGRFRVDVPHATPDEMSVPLIGVAADNDLVVWPDRVDFGDRPVGRTHARAVYVFNTGEDTHQIYPVELTGADRTVSLTSAPPPVVLRPGDSTRFDLAWSPSTPGSLRSTLRFDSDHLPAAVRVQVTGEAIDSACGHVEGTICAPHGAWNAPGVAVTVTSGAQQVETSTDERGRFFASCLPPGLARVEARQGHFAVAQDVTIVRGQTATLPAGTCLSPPPAAQVAVVTGAFDRVQSILTTAGVAHTIVNGVQGPPRLLTDRELLLGYDLLFLNCGFDDSAVRDHEVAANLRAFVQAGGSLYVSDLAYDALEALAPEALELAGDDTALNAAQVGRVVRLDARVLDPALLPLLGPSLEVALDGDYALVEGAAPDATVHLVGATSGPGAGSKPLAITYQPPGARGRVVYTTVHESALLLDPNVRALLEYLVFSL